MSPATQQDEVSGFWQRALRLAQVISLCGAVALYLLWGRAAALGLLLGAIVSILRFSLRYRAMRGRPDAARLVRLRLAGYLLSGAALGLAFGLSGLFSPWTTAGGLLVMNVAIVATELTARNQEAGGRWQEAGWRQEAGSRQETERREAAGGERQKEEKGWVR
ncbi:MAG: hypothetical protein J7M08_09070 [Planctomycetes bacterium]|nr:hypothetical protein [Planctomycetota bacterium]